MDKSLIFNIRISDVNDHAPQFPEKEFNITVQENQTAGVCGWGAAVLPSVSALFLFINIDEELDPSHLQGEFLLFTSQRSQDLDLSEML